MGLGYSKRAKNRRNEAVGVGGVRWHFLLGETSGITLHCRLQCRDRASLLETFIPFCKVTRGERRGRYIREEMSDWTLRIQPFMQQI